MKKYHNQRSVAVLGTMNWLFGQMREFFMCDNPSKPYRIAMDFIDFCRDIFIHVHYEDVFFTVTLHGAPALDHKSPGNGLALSLQELMDATDRQVDTLDKGSYEYKVLHALLGALYAYFGRMGYLGWRRYVEFN